MQLFKSRKLHYGKYLYKLAIVNSFSSFFRTEHQKDGQLGYARSRLDDIFRHLDTRKPQIEIPLFYGSKYVSIDEFYDAVDIFRHLKSSTEYLVRCERGSISIYSNDKSLLIKLGNKIRGNVVEFHEPDLDMVNTLINNKDIILVDTLPVYEYKLTFGKKLGKAALVDWIEKNPHLAKIGSVARQCCNKEGYVKGYYFYVRDKKALTLAQLLIGDNIQRIQQLVHTDK